MSSQTDKKEEFRKYLEKGNVLTLLTTILTDLFEMDNKPDDPCQYLHQRFGEAITKNQSSPTPNSEAPATQSQADPAAVQQSAAGVVPAPLAKDITMAEAQPNAGLTASIQTPIVTATPIQTATEAPDTVAPNPGNAFASPDTNANAVVVPPNVTPTSNVAVLNTVAVQNTSPVPAPVAVQTQTANHVASAVNPTDGQQQAAIPVTASAVPAQQAPVQ